MCLQCVRMHAMFDSLLAALGRASQPRSTNTGYWTPTYALGATWASPVRQDSAVA